MLRAFVCEPQDQISHVGRLNPFRKIRDRKSTRLNSSHGYISYAVFCLKKNKPADDRRYLAKSGLGGPLWRVALRRCLDRRIGSPPLRRSTSDRPPHTRADAPSRSIDIV